VARVVPVNTLWEQAFAPALAAARESGATAFGPHPCTETVLAFSRSLGWLIGAFHKTGNRSAGPRAVTVGSSPALSTQRLTSVFAAEATRTFNVSVMRSDKATSRRDLKSCQFSEFLE
jgi:hypothetical protein